MGRNEVENKKKPGKKVIPEEYKSLSYMRDTGKDTAYGSALFKKFFIPAWPRLGVPGDFIYKP